MIISSTQLTTPLVRSYHLHAPIDRDIRHKVRTMYTPRANLNEIRFHAMEQTHAFMPKSTRRYHKLIPEPNGFRMTGDNLAFERMEILQDYQEPRVYGDHDLGQINPDELLEADFMSYYPFIGTIFVGLIAGFFFEAYGETDHVEDFLEIDDEVIEEDACGRFYV